MTSNDRQKTLIRARMQREGEPYSVAKRALASASNEEMEGLFAFSKNQQRFNKAFPGIPDSSKPRFIYETLLPSQQSYELALATEKGNRRASTPFDADPIGGYYPVIHCASFYYSGEQNFESVWENLEIWEPGTKTPRRYVMSAIGRLDNNDEEIIGTVGEDGFRLWWVDYEVILDSIFSPVFSRNQTEPTLWMYEYMMRFLLERIARTIDSPLVMVTAGRPTFDTRSIRIKNPGKSVMYRLHDTSQYDASSLTATTNADWIRFSYNVADETHPEGTVDIFFAEKNPIPQMMLRADDTEVHVRIRSMDKRHLSVFLEAELNHINGYSAR